MSDSIIEKTCSKCKKVKANSEFYPRKNSMHGTRSECKTCWCKAAAECQKKNRAGHNAACRRYRQTHKEQGLAYQKRHNQTEHRKVALRGYAAKQHRKHPERTKANNAVNHAVTRGDLPRAKSLGCAKCPKQAKHYHHYLGYEKEHWLDVLPLCVPCHRKDRKLSA